MEKYYPMNKNKLELTEYQKDGMLYVYYINKLKEFKLIEGNIPNLTLKGFELAHELYEDGRKINMNTIIQYTNEILVDADNHFRKTIIKFIEHIQNVGFDEMKKEIQQIKENE
jgi:hypothetical protein